MRKHNGLALDEPAPTVHKQCFGAHPDGIEVECLLCNEEWICEEATHNNPLRFTCPKCGSHELALVQTRVVHYTVVRTNASGELSYQSKPSFVENDNNHEDCYFACGGYCPTSDHPCDFIPSPDNDPDHRISDDYAMLEWIKNHKPLAAE